MSRFSPTVRPRSGREGEPRASDRIIRALGQLRRSQLQEEDRERQEELDEMRRQRHEADLAERGFRTEAPTEDVRLPASDQDVLTSDIDLGGAPGGARTRRARELESVLFPGSGPAPRIETDRRPGGQAGVRSGGDSLIDELEQLKHRGPTLPEDAHGGPRESRGRGDTGAGPGRGGPLLDELAGLNRRGTTPSREAEAAPRRGRTPPDTGALGADEFMIRALDQVRQQGPAPRGEGPAPGEEQDPAVRHPPGAFVPEAMDFTTEAIFEGPQVDTRIGLQRPVPERTVERVPDRVERVSDDLFFDPEATPEARQRARAREAAAEQADALATLLDLTPEERQAIKANPNLASQILESRQAERSARTTQAQNRAAFERLQQMAPDIYSEFVPGFDYQGELDEVFSGRRDLAGDKEMADFFQERGFGPRGQRLDTPGSSRSSERLPTFSQAMDVVRDFYATRNREGFITGYSLSNSEMFDLAEQMAQGELEPSELPEVEREPVDAGDDGLSDLLEEEEEEREKVPGARGILERWLPGGRSGFVEPDSTPRASEESGRDELDRARQLVQNYPEIPDDEMREILSEEGFTESEIDRILGGS